MLQTVNWQNCMEPVKENKKKLTKKDMTALDWFFVEVFSKMILGEKYQVKQNKKS
jgi:hypothetical protein